MMEHPIVLAVFLAVVAFFIWQWIDAKRPAREPAFRPGYLAVRSVVRTGMRWVGWALLGASVFALVSMVAVGSTPMGIFAIIALFAILFAFLALKTSPR